VFGKWKGVVDSIPTSFIVVYGALTLIGCCIILYIQGLKIWVIETALAKHIPVSLQLLLSTDEIESKFMLKEFEEKNMK
jgi:hypothetical protein